MATNTALRRARRIVSAQRQKPTEEFNARDIALVNHVAASIDAHNISHNNQFLIMAAVMQHHALTILAAKKKDKNANLDLSAKTMVEALSSFMGVGGQLISALRKKKTAKMSQSEAKSLADAVEDVTDRLKVVLDKLK